MSSDPRTASISGERSALRQLAKVSAVLFSELQPNERVTWAMSSAGMTPSVAVITSQRLLAIPLVPNQKVRTAAAPYRVELGKKKFMGQSVEVTNSYGASVSLLPHHAVSQTYLQGYLNEYVWRYNHRDRFDGPAQFGLLLARAVSVVHV